jgi:hypothetical protein
MRLIDADALRDALGITGTKESCKGCQYNKRFNFACNTDDAPSFAYVCEAIDEAPTIDAVPVTRCKDCVHAFPADTPHTCTRSEMRIKAYGFCAWATKRRQKDDK